MDDVDDAKFIISIHALVKRATPCHEEPVSRWSISIHALVKRATHFANESQIFHLYFNPRPREEGDRFSPCFHQLTLHFNPRPREEGD